MTWLLVMEISVAMAVGFVLGWIGHQICDFERAGGFFTVPPPEEPGR
jgi:hypothetical protein